MRSSYLGSGSSFTCRQGWVGLYQTDRGSRQSTHCAGLSNLPNANWLAVLYLVFHQMRLVCKNWPWTVYFKALARVVSVRKVINFPTDTALVGEEELLIMLHRQCTGLPRPVSDLTGPIHRPSHRFPPSHISNGNRRRTG